MQNRPKPVVLLILDGWGVAPAGAGNTLFSDQTPTMNSLVKNFPAMTLRASGEAVGLMWGEMGNSEVGHLTIGAGRILYQALPRINLAIENGYFPKNKVLVEAVDHAEKNNSTVHIIGILSSGNVHGSNAHIVATLKALKEHGVKNAAVHVILDGRDTIYNTGVDFVKELVVAIDEIGLGRLASISGRFYAMDRDSRWDRVEAAYLAMLGQSKNVVIDAVAAIKASYDKKVYDEELEPVTILMSDKSPQPPLTKGGIGDGDAVIFTNFRPDRARELTAAFVASDFKGFKRTPIADLFFATMTEYDKNLPTKVLFPPEIPETCLAKELANHGLTQLHIAETEKYAHVTFFLNAMTEDAYVGEDRVIVPSPKVASYDMVPAMAAVEITNHIVEAVSQEKYDVIIANFANADMVAHTGNFEATKAAATAIDGCIQKITEVVLRHSGITFITADHGNGEELVNINTNEIDKEHSTNPVPFIAVAESLRGQTGGSGDVVGDDLSLTPPVGMLADVAPTILKILNLPLPKSMTGNPLL